MKMEVASSSTLSVTVDESTRCHQKDLNLHYMWLVCYVGPFTLIAVLCLLMTVQWFVCFHCGGCSFLQKNPTRCSSVSRFYYSLS